MQNVTIFINSKNFKRKSHTSHTIALVGLSFFHTLSVRHSVHVQPPPLSSLINLTRTTRLILVIHSGHLDIRVRIRIKYASDVLHVQSSRPQQRLHLLPEPVPVYKIPSQLQKGKALLLEQLFFQQCGLEAAFLQCTFSPSGAFLSGTQEGA